MTPKQTVTKFGEQLSRRRQELRLSLRELAQLAGVSHEAVRLFDIGEGKTIAPLIAIAGRLGYRLVLEPAPRGPIIRRVESGARVPNGAETD